MHIPHKLLQEGNHCISMIIDSIPYNCPAQSTPFAKCFVLDDVFPFQLKKLRHYLRQRNVGKVTIKKRGSPLDPDALRHRLRLRGDEHRVIFLTHVLGEPMVLIGMHTRLDSDSA